MGLSKRFTFSNIARVVLASALAVSTCADVARAGTNAAPSLKLGEFTDFARASYYSAFALFTLSAGTNEQHELVLKLLTDDSSPKALDAIGEIAALSEDDALATRAFNILLEKRPQSAKALLTVAHLSYDDERRALAEKAYDDIAPAEVKAANPRGPIPFEKQIEALKDVDLDAAKALLTNNAGDLKKLMSVPEDLTNGSRYVVQSWFLKKILSLQKSPDEERKLRLDFLLNEVSQYLSKPARTVKIETPEDFAAFKESLTSRFATLPDEMKFSKGLSDQTPVQLDIAPAMVAEVKAFSDSFRQFDRKVLGETYFFDLLTNDRLPGHLVRLRLKAESDQDKLAQLRQISDEFDQQYRGLQTVAQTLIDAKAIQFKVPAEQRFFELMITHYFSTYSFEETANVMKAIIERPDQQTSNDLFNLMVMYAGPQMQKLLQVVGRRQGISPELSAIFKQLEESGLASPWERVGPNFVKPPKGYEWVSLDRKAFVGSMAETYKGVVRNLQTGERLTVAARTLKSDIRERVEREIPRLLDLGRVIDSDPILRAYDFPLVGPVMDDVMQMARAELDVQATIANQKMGEAIYTGDVKLANGLTVHFQTARTLESENPDVIYTTWLDGEKFEDFVNDDPALATQVAEATAYHWIDNALFKQRFFHADLHQGNLKDERVSPNLLDVDLLDFGMVGRLQLGERSTIIKLSLAASSNTNAPLIAKYLYDLSEKDKNKISLEELTRSAKLYLKANRGPLLTMDIWIGWSLSKGLKLPKNITAFSRGIGAVEQLTIASGSKKYLADMVKDVALQHKLELAPDLARYLRDHVVTTVTEAARKVGAKITTSQPGTCSALFTIVN